ncbi:ADP-heptose synthase / D-glycero-beta-D-manno-heptose 7-phosphate kinase [Candidatus Velamenicoccus archaeovorus]|uniref:D-glycero-beta-D-manno-heptose 1-phosphate adenylyltransferase n=1 Tax=Velamenicoccus archaeovorus TaxID=1930593 RepID=A0A410P472_VELA1|nr:ADP-heptose synthase / D-glycero-beta-D-manno-heptose 7-phosphate kinase [Candidatus Velamenicoccus archaeovorus]
MHKKIVTLRRLKDILRCSSAKKVVFTNGCFDILHYGHVAYLEKAKTLGDILIVGLNSDVSVRRLKGKKRPVNDETDRAHVLAALACVDYVVLFRQDTPLELIRALKPDVLAKGGDWNVSRIVGAEEVLADGGKVCVIPYIKNRSTTAIIEKIRRLS